MLWALSCPGSFHDVPPPATAYWVEELLLLALAWVGVLIFRRCRPHTHLLFISMVLPAIGTALTFGQLSSAVDELGAAIVLWSCLLATLVVYLLIMRDECKRLVKVMLPTARVLRR